MGNTMWVAGEAERQIRSRDLAKSPSPVCSISPPTLRRRRKRPYIVVKGYKRRLVEKGDFVSTTSNIDNKRIS